MIDTIAQWGDMAVDFIQNSGPIIGILVIILESIIPVLPLSVFIAINILSFGSLLGFIISSLATVAGCMLSFIIVRKLFNERFNKRIRKAKKIRNIIKTIDNIDLSILVLIVALPFTPAFAINIAGGLSNISQRKYFTAMMIGKPFMVYFWSYIGANLVDMFKDPIILLKVIAIMVVAFIISKIFSKKFKLN